MLLWLAAFALTQLVECPVYLLAQRDSPRRVPARLAFAFGASAMTHPIVWFVFPWLSAAAGEPGGYIGMVAVAETFAVLVEALYLCALRVRRAVAWALAANLASFSTGLLVRYTLGWI